MAQSNEKVQQAMAAYKAGRKEEARALLMEVVDQDERNEEAWLWLSALVETLEEQQICLENALSINPDNERARKGLDAVNQKIAAQGGSPGAFTSPPASTPPSAPPARSSSGSGPIGAEFASTSGDNLVGGASPRSSTGSSWDASAPAGGAFDNRFSSPAEPSPSGGESDLFGLPTSVDWAHGGSPAHGSGKQVDLPSAQEYDDWVQGLNLRNDAAAHPAGPDSQRANEEFSSLPSSDVSPFGDTSFMADPSLFTPAQPAASSGSVDTPFGESDTSPWGSDADPFAEQSAGGPFMPESSPFESKPTSPFDAATSAAFESPASPAAKNLFVGGAAAAGSSPFAFDEGDLPDDSAVFGGEQQGASTVWAAGLEESAAPMAKGSPAGIKIQDYFRLIPSDIEAQAGRQSGVVLGVVVLVVLNLLSFGYLLAGLLG